MDCSLLSSSVHGVFQAIVLEWIAISFSSRSSQPRDGTQLSSSAGGFFISWATREAPQRHFIWQSNREAGSCGQATEYDYNNKGAPLVAQTAKNLPTMQETWVRSLGQEDPLEKGMANHSNILAWRISWRGVWWATVHGIAKLDTTEWLMLRTTL